MVSWVAEYVDCANEIDVAMPRQAACRSGLSASEISACEDVF
jgi:hypothetical protein